MFNSTVKEKDQIFKLLINTYIVFAFLGGKKKGFTTVKPGDGELYF